jgi:single-strand DNA-binding protein
MANFNKVILIGNLTRDPELSYLPNSQTPVVEVGIAVNRTWRGQDGQQREETTFVDCSAYGRQAEVINQYMRKGRPLMIEGRLRLSQWETQDGQRRSKLRVVIENFQFLGGRDGGQGGGGGGGGGYSQDDSYSQQRRSQPQRQSRPRQQQPPQDQYDEPVPPDYDDGGGNEDIPF